MGYELLVAQHVVPEVLEQAIRRVCHRHEALRTKIIDSNDDLDSSSPEYLWHGFRNVAAGQPVVSFELGSLPDARQPDADEPRWLPAVRADPRYLPVFRFQLIDRSPDRVLRIITDHALCDRWSLFVLQRDIERTYKQALDGASVTPSEAYPFSAFAMARYDLWASGAFDERLRIIEQKVAALDMQALAGTGRGQHEPDLIKSFVILLSTMSTARFEMAHAQLKVTRLALAIALFAEAVGTEFGWRRIALLVPHANRTVRALGSVGLFADAHYLFISLEAGFEAVARDVCASLEEDLARVPPPPAALVQASPVAREALGEAMPRLAADVRIKPRGRGPRRAGPADVFIETSSDDPGSPDEDSVTFSCPPSFPAQPDLRLVCDFSQRHRLAVNFREDRVTHTAARSIALTMLRRIQDLAVSGPPSGNRRLR